MIEIPKTRLGVFAVEDPTLGTAVVQGNQMSVAIVGETLGAVTNIVDEPVVRQQSTLSDDLIHTDVSKISRIADIIGGVASYIQDTDYRLNSDSVEWLGTTLAPPSNVIGVAQSVVPVAPRTGLVAATYDYVITAIRTSSILTTPATVGETLPSAQVAVVVNPGGSPSTNAALLTWVPVVNAEGYRIYRKLSTDPNYDDALIAEIPGGASNFFLDDGYTAAFYADVTAATTANIADQ